MVAARPLQSDSKKQTLRSSTKSILHEKNSRCAFIALDKDMLKFFKSDLDAVLLFNQILYWSDRTDDPDGWFYKTYADWKDELGLSRHQINRILHGDPRTSKPKQTLASLGVETMVRRGRYTGNPTVHYRINPDVLFKVMLDYYQQTGCLPSEKWIKHSLLKQIYALIRNNVADGSATESLSGLQQCCISEVQQTRTSKESEITTEKESSEKDSIISHPPPDDDSDLQIFKPFVNRFGKIKKHALALRAEVQRLGAGRVGEVLERCATRGRSWNYVLRALANETSDTVGARHASPAAVEKPQQQPAVDWSIYLANNDPDLPALEIVQPPVTPISPRVNTAWELFGRTQTAQSAWSAAVHQMEMQFGGDSHLVKEAVLVDFEAKGIADAPTFVVAVRNEHVRDRLQYPFYRTARRILSDACGRAVEVRFVAKADWSLPEDIQPDGG